MAYPRILKKPTLYLEIDSHDGSTVYRISNRSHNRFGYEWIGLILTASGNSPSIHPDTFESYSGSFQFTLINNKPVFGQVRFSDLAAVEYFTREEARVYWAYEDSVTWTMIYSGIVSQLTDIKYETCSLSLVDWVTCLEKKAPWPMALEKDYPGIDPDDVGKIINTIYGTVKRAPALAIDAGGKTTLAKNLLATETSGNIEVSDGSKFPEHGSFVVQIENEQILISSRSGNVFVISDRGYHGTSEYIVDHDKGQAIAEINSIDGNPDNSEYVYLLANHSLQAIDNVYVDEIRQIEDPPDFTFETYTGQLGNQHPNYPGKAVIIFNVLPSFAKQINLEAEDSIRFYDGDTYSGEFDGILPQQMFYMTEHQHLFEDQTVASVHTASGTCTKNANNCAVDNTSNNTPPMWTFTGQQEVELSSAFKLLSPIRYVTSAPAGTALWYRIIVDYDVMVPWDGACMVRFSANNPTNPNVYSWWYTMSCSTVGTYSRTFPDSSLGWAGAAPYSWFELLNSGVSFKGYDLSQPDGYVLIRKVELQVMYAPADGGSKPALGTLPDGSLYRVGTVSITGNSSADVVIGKTISADCTGYNISRPDQVRAHMLTNQYGANYDSASFAAAGTIFGSLGYRFGICINENITFKEIQELFLKQCRTALYWIGDTEYMKFLM